MAADKAFEQRMPIDATALLSRFTSLGDNCEFGLVQRRAGVEKISLLRFAFSKIGPLIDSVRDGFADLDPLTDVRIEQPWNDEYISFFGTGGFFQHTFLHPDEADPVTLRTQELRRIPFLRRMLLEEFRTGETILVRKSPKHAPAHMEELHHALRRHGPNTLLWVELAGPGHPSGSVEVPQDGLLRGYVDRFPPAGEASAVSFECWLRLCLRSHMIVKGALPQLAEPGSLLGGMSAGKVVGAGPVTCVEDAIIRPPVAGAAVFAHTAQNRCEGAAALMWPDPPLPPGEVYTASLWIFLPGNFGGRLVAPVLLDAMQVQVQPAILLERDRWQRIWVCGLVPHTTRVHSAIWAEMEAGGVFFTTRWTIERGSRLGDYLLGVNSE